MLFTRPLIRLSKEQPSAEQKCDLNVGFLPAPTACFAGVGNKFGKTKTKMSVDTNMVLEHRTVLGDDKEDAI